MDWNQIQKLLESLPEDGYIEVTQRVVTIETIAETIEKPQKVIDLQPTDWYLDAPSQHNGENDNG